ncbi:helix-turn-helix domain-containing protein [Streptomyces coeruleoprunus]|uniref:Helix-turn-helix domain-containing protein n=1 Tax=Streptomyces coeruleoprunus TaxID=285563 RepID=A0ABV9XMN0_9ACTN
MRDGGGAAECVRLASELRRLRERSGLSLAALATRTAYSKSSWERYLNGKKPVPRRAVEALCALVGEPPGRLLALWELADAEWSGRAHAPRPAPPGPASGPTARSGPGRTPAPAAVRHRRTRPTAVVLVLVSLGVLVGAALFAVLALLPGKGGEPVREPLLRNPGCSGRTCEGKDPLAMGCGGAGMVTTLATRTAEGGRRLELRHAELCGTIWVRTTGLRAGDTVELTLPDGRRRRIDVDGPGDTGRYLVTTMAAADLPADGVRVCLHVARAGPRPDCFSPA